MSKAKNSPLRDKMLELHRAGVDVKFVGDDDAQIFVVKIERGVSLDQHFAMLEEIRRSIDRSIVCRSDKRLTRQSAQKFVENMKKLNI